MTNEDRIKFYLGHRFSQGDFTKHHGITINELTDNDIYDSQLKMLLLHTNHSHQRFSYLFGDIEHECDEMTLCKNRCSFNENGVILRCLEFSRHWVNYYNRPKDILFQDKKNSLFWRGTTTGQPNRKGNRFDLVTTWCNKHPNIDVGFSFTCQDKDAYASYVKGVCDIEYFLSHKYILSVEGNDKDSGLQWKLNSNSLVLMPAPRVTTWLMETTLIPNYHYVLLNDDFSDVEEKLNWCNENETECLSIIRNANHFMSQFSNHENEQQIEIDVIHSYFQILEAKSM